MGRMRRVCALLAVHILAPMALVAQARTFDVDIAAGAAITTGLFGSHNRGGPLLRIGVTSRSDQRSVRYRLDAEAFAVGQASPRLDLGTADGIRSGAVTYSALLGPVRSGFAPYALLGGGMGVIWHTIPEGFPGIVVNAKLGAGVRHQYRGVGISAEVALVRPARSPGSGGYVPLSIGVRF